MAKTVLIKTYAEACKKLKRKASDLPDVSMLQKDEQKAIIAHYKLTVICKALNLNCEPEADGWKYYPYFYKNKPGVGFSCADYYDDLTCTTVGSRLSYNSSELAIYAGKQFIELYKEYMV